MRSELVKDWMTPDPVCATTHTSLPDALQMMQERRIRRLPVVDHDKLMGIVTRGDLRGAQPSEATSLSIYEVNYLLGRLTLDRIMSKNIVTVTPGTTIGDAARLMLKHKIAGLPVVEGGRIVGILTESDVFRMVVTMWEQEDKTPATQ
ncbi:MAG TPA: CBS domain-containing protein [Anaerolineales bacterium]|nr:CBS domain-containing protein [Anaerolineales bacterium]